MSPRPDSDRARQQLGSIIQVRGGFGQHSFLFGLHSTKWEQCSANTGLNATNLGSGSTKLAWVQLTSARIYLIPVGFGQIQIALDQV